MKGWKGFVDSVASKFAFFPPQPSTYKVHEHIDGHRELYIQPLIRGYPKVLGCEVVKLDTRLGETIVGAYFPRRSRTRTYRVPTILFSHGNAVDLGVLLGFFRELARDIDVAIMCYDYTGYGDSSGHPSVENSLADIDAAYKWLRDKGVEPAEIVLYGQSVGSGPTAYLAAKEHGLAGVILHSPMATGMRVLKPDWRWWPKWADVYVNVSLVPRIAAPVLVMHGQKDDVINVSAGRILHRLAQKPFDPLFDESADITVNGPSVCFDTFWSPVQ